MVGLGFSIGIVSRFCFVLGAILSADVTLTYGADQRAPAPFGFGHATATVEGVVIHYLIGGSGPPIVLLHGWPVTAYAWRKVGPRLATHFTVIAPDMPGFGDSGPSLRGYEKSVIADQLHTLVQQLGFNRIALVGHDMGGPVAVAYAANYSTDVWKLALVETMMPGFGLEDLKATAAWHMGFAEVRSLPEALVAGKEREFLSYFYRRGTQSDDGITDADLDEYVRAYSLPGRMSASFEYYRALNADIPAFRNLTSAKLTMPILAIGAGRGIGSDEKTFQQFATNVTSVTISNSGHHIPDDRPDALAQILLDFFTTQP